MNITHLLLDWNRKNRYSVALYAICQPNTNIWSVTHKQCCCYHHMEWPREHSEVKALEQERTWVASSLLCTSGVLVWQITNCDQSSPMLKQQLTELRMQQWLKTTTATSIAHAFFHWPPKQVSLHSAPNTLLSAGFEIDSPWNPGIVCWSCWNEVYPMEHDFLLYRDMFWTCWRSSGGLAGTPNWMKTKELQALLAHFLLQRK